MGVLKVRVGGAWQAIGQGFNLSSPGYVGHDVTGSAVGLTSATPIDLGARVTFTADPARRYKTTVFTGAITKDASAAAHASAQITTAAAGGTVLMIQRQYLVANAVGYITIQIVETGLSGTITRNAMGAISAGTATVGAGTFVLVEDITSATPVGLAPAWVNFTPTLSQGASSNIAKTINYSRYVQVGKTVTWVFSMNAQAAGPGAAVIQLTLPVAPAVNAGVVGNAAYYDVTAPGTRYICSIEGGGGSLIVFGSNGASTDAFGASPNIPVGSGDGIKGSVTYEAA